MRVFFQFITFAGLLTISCSDDSDLPIVGDLNGDSLKIVDAFPSLDFNRPVDLQNNGGDNLFVVEQLGVIKVFHNNPSTETAEIFLDIQSIVDDRGNEEGLLGLSFHPDFAQNGYFYVNYTTSLGTTRISRFEVDTQNPTVADPSSELVLLEFSQPFGNHNGGQLTFGPDGYLYIAVGDGGSGGDPQGHGQNTSTLLGSILRIDVDNPSGNLYYGIPSDNPFAGNQSGVREEIFAYGLRNPWRMSFDVDTGLLWAGDVGQNEFEEIDVIENGGNYGWRIMEAADCFQSASCEQSGLIEPTYHYGHDKGNASITGGVVYRGSIASLVGWYVYADYASGRIWALESSSTDPNNQLLLDSNHRITSFGTDHLQELYYCSQNGKIYKFSID
jgi:glucose/arabinose dehydrogenase